MAKWLVYIAPTLFVFATLSARAETIELTVTGRWSEGDFKVAGRPGTFYNAADPAADGKVFDLSPSDGSMSLILLVSTDNALFFARDSETSDSTGRIHSLTHDFYGYSDVKLVGGYYTFGGAVWNSSGVLKDLIGPNGSKAALWTDVDITKVDPTRLSFRMFGKAGKLSADLFVGSRTPSTIGRQFLLWEYYAGEEIRSSKYTARARTLSTF